MRCVDVFSLNRDKDMKVYFLRRDLALTPGARGHMSIGIVLRTKDLGRNPQLDRRTTGTYHFGPLMGQMDQIAKT